MTSERRNSELALYDAMAGGAVLGGPRGDSGPSDTDGGDSFWTIVDRRLRGRWRMAILIAAALALAAGMVGYFSAKPQYRSVGAIQITPHAQPVLHELGEHTIASYPQFVATEILHIKNRNVLELALENTELAKLPDARKPGAVNTLIAGIDPQWDRESKIVTVEFESPDPVFAKAAVNAILQAYYTLYGRFGGIELTEIQDKLASLEAAERRELNSVRMRRQALVSKYQTTNLSALQAANMERALSLETRITDARSALERLNRAQAQGAPRTIAPTDPQLDAFNPLLAQRRQLRDSAQLAFDFIKENRNPESRQYLDYQDRAEQTQRAYEQEYQRTIARWNVLPPEEQATRGTGFEGRSPQELEDLLKDDETQLAAIKQRGQELVKDLQTLESIIYQEQQVEEKLREYRNRITQLDVESKQLTGIIQIVQDGYLPDYPSSDARWKRAIMGGGLALFATFGSFFLLGSIDRRAYGTSQLSAAGKALPPCLGVLPNLEATIGDPETTDVASHCVHQIRNQIESLRTPGGGYVLALSSPFQGDGKTSIVMALGWSYAAAGYKTLVIDCDFVGRSLTRQLGLVGREGLKEALVAGELNGSVSKLPVEHLSAVPVGVDARFGPENLRRGDLQLLLDQVRDRFDLILIDTGPLLGALESTPVMAAADGVVLSVRRGRSRTRLEECVGRLRMIGTPCLGVILNCAARSDCQRYVSDASLAAAEEDRAGRPEGRGPDIVHVAPGERNALVQAIQTTTRTRRPGLETR